jgi:hypothetical protein
MKYQVEVTRLSYARHIMEIVADSSEEARRIAVETAPEEEFSTYESEYEISSIRPSDFQGS